MSFNPDIFIGTEVTGAHSTELIAVPEGQFAAVISKITPREFISNKDQLFRVVDLLWDLDDSDGAIKAITQRDTNRVRQTLFLDCLEDEDGNFAGLSMAEGDNVALGRLREALDQNDPTMPWSFSMLMSQVAILSIRHKISEEYGTQAEVSGIRALAV